MINDNFQTPDSYKIVTNSLCLQREFQVVPGSDTQVPGRSCIQRHSLEHRTQSEYIYLLLGVPITSPFFYLLMFNTIFAPYHLTSTITSYI